MLDDAGRAKGVRALGGSIKFGETAEAAFIREFYEELGIAVTVLRPAVFIENTYIHEGRQGHEILAIFDVVVPDQALSGAIRVEFHEGDGTKCFAEWYDLDAFDLSDGPQLYTEGLKAHLLRPR